jgi:hypothetical protein
MVYKHSLRVGSESSAMDRAFEAGQGIVRLAPTWVPRFFSTPARRLRLHPEDYYPFGKGRGGIVERWMSSTIRAHNGPLTGPHEGLSMVVDPDRGLVPFDEFVEHHGADVLGARIWKEYQGWPMYAKFFDNVDALPLHIHHNDEYAALLGKRGKPEAYYYPPELNNHLGAQPISFLGLNPETTVEEFKVRLARFKEGGDNRITELSRGYRTRLGTGWDIPAGILHAPASVCTYEPQAASDIQCMCESWSNGAEVPESSLWGDVPSGRRGDLDFIVELVDWEANTDPRFLANRFMVPIQTKQSTAEGESGFSENWIVYRSSRFSSKELRVNPGASVVIHDVDAYGCVVLQGHGSMNAHQISATTIIRFGELTSDEFFVSERAASGGVRVHNNSTTEPLVILKHFGPGNREHVASADILPGGLS